MSISKMSNNRDSIQVSFHLRTLLTVLLVLLFSLFPAVLRATESPQKIAKKESEISIDDSLSIRMQQMGLIDVQQLDSRILVDLKYASCDNFAKTNMYGSIGKAYLEPGFARRIAKAQALLSRSKPGFHLLIYDAARPFSVQKYMYSLVADTPLKVYVANGKRGGRHNYGVAVDLTIANAQGQPIDMGTSFDHFGIEAHVGREVFLSRKGLISAEAVRNRALLKRIMEQVGLRPYKREWWHYEERISMKEVRMRYRLLDF